MGEDSLSDKAWLDYCKQIEDLLGIDLDGDFERDGYSLDEAHGLFTNRTPAKEAAFFFRIRMQERGK